MSKYKDEDIRAYDNVPVSVAADYLGVVPMRLRNAIKSGKMPFLGVSVDGEKSMFIISPGGLINWKNGNIAVEIKGGTKEWSC